MRVNLRFLLVRLTTWIIVKWSKLLFFMLKIFVLVKTYQYYFRYSIINLYLWNEAVWIKGPGWQIVIIWKIQKTPDICSQSKTWITESVNEISLNFGIQPIIFLRFCIIQIFTICQPVALNSYDSYNWILYLTTKRQSFYGFSKYDQIRNFDQKLKMTKI